MTSLSLLACGYCPVAEKIGRLLRLHLWSYCIVLIYSSDQGNFAGCDKL